MLKIINGFKNKFFGIKEGYDQINKLYFRKDPLKIDNYIQKRLSKNEISHIVSDYINMKLPLFIINQLFDAHTTNIAVERSFSLLGEILQYDRPFNE